MNSSTSIPRHVGIIMDGNRRWAKSRGLAVIKGHAYAVENTVEELIEKAGEMGVEYLTMWAFSTENWNRDDKEVSGLMSLFRMSLATKVDKFIEKGARLNLIGDINRFDVDIREGMLKAIKKSEINKKITVTFALNYGGRDEILRAVNRAIELGNKVNETEFGELLDTKNIPDVDYIIRTGGVQRMSGFMPWQGVYAEYYFTNTLFPDFSKEKFVEAIEEYGVRQRRFGK